MPALVAGEVDAGDRLARAREDGLRERARLAREREDRAVVVGVLVAVEQAGAAGLERGADRLQRREVSALGDVRDGEEGHAAPASLGRRRGRGVATPAP